MEEGGRERQRRGRGEGGNYNGCLLVPGMITLLSGFIMSHGLQMQSCLSGVGRNDILTGLWPVLVTMSCWI